ncbi:MAG: GAF and ANTAR domain-containing protein [Propionibacteriaceae bacterium]
MTRTPPFLPGDDSSPGGGTSVIEPTWAAMAASKTTRVRLHSALVDVADRAVTAVAPAADGAGVTLIADGVVLMTAASAPFVIEVDALQYGRGEGPCITAAAENRIVHTGQFGAGERRWPRFGSDIASLGVHSVASFPLCVDDDVIGSINMYAFAADAFDSVSIEVGRQISGPLAIAVNHAQLLATTQLLGVQLGGALEDRAVIDSAVGVLMFRGGIDAEQAGRHLRDIAEMQHLELASVAQVIVTDALVWTRDADASPSA